MCYITIMANKYEQRIKPLMEKRGMSNKSLSLAAGLGATYVRDLFSGSDPSVGKLSAIARVLDVPLSYLAGDADGISEIVGRVGADTEGVILFSEGHGGFGEVVRPSTVGTDAVAVEVFGHSMGRFLDGSLIFYSEQKAPPTDNILGDVVVVGLADGRALVKRILRGSRPGLYDLESVNGPVLTDQEVQWVAEIETIVPPKHAKRLKL